MRRKQIYKFLAISITLVALLLLVACGSKQTTTGTNGGTSASVEGNNSNQQTFTLKMSSTSPEQANPEKRLYYPGTWFQQELEKRSDGRLKVNIHYSNSLVPNDRLFDALASGSVDLGHVAMDDFSNDVPISNFSRLPYWTTGGEQAFEIMTETEIRDIIEEEFLKHGLRPLLHSVAGEWGFMLNKPVHKVEDMRGLIMNAADGLTNNWYNSIGVSGVNLAPPEIYDALQRGIVNGVSSGLIGLENVKWGEVVEYVVLPPLTGSYTVQTFISEKTWQKLPEDLQNIILEVSKEVEQLALEKTVAENAMLPEVYKKYNIEVIELTNEEKQKFIDSSKGVWDDFANVSENGAKIVEILRQYQGAGN